jgi:hypothetical protein
MGRFHHSESGESLIFNSRGLRPGSFSKPLVADTESALGVSIRASRLGGTVIPHIERIGGAFSDDHMIKERDIHGFGRLP